MSKTKSIVITVLLTLAVAVATFFAAVSFPVSNDIQRLNSVTSYIPLGADFSGYAYATVYPEGVYSPDEYNSFSDEERALAKYEQAGNLWVDTEINPDVDKLKEEVRGDAEKLNARFGQKGYSSYSVALENELGIKISVPTNFNYAAYKGYDQTSRSNSLNIATAALTNITADGNLTLRTTDTSIDLTDADGNTSTYDLTKKGKDEWVDKAMATPENSSTAQKTYSLAGDDDPTEYFSSVTSRTVGSYALITFNLSAEGAKKFEALTTRAASSSSQVIYFFVGDTQLVSYKCEAAVSGGSITLQSSDAATAENSAIVMNSTVIGGALSAKYRDIESVSTSSAAGGELASILALVACVVAIIGLAVFLVLKYKRLGGVFALVAYILALVELYAMVMLEIQVTFAVIFVAMLCIALFAISNAIVYNEVKKLTEVGHNLRSAIKDAYKKRLMTITDMHIVLVIAAIFLAAVAAGEAAACGLVAVIGVVASYVLYWFTRVMWHVMSFTAKDKYTFAGLKKAGAKK